MSLSVKQEGDRVLFVDERNVKIGGIGKETASPGIKGWEKESVSGLWHWFCHDVMGWVVDVQLGNKTFVLGKQSAEYFIKRNFPHLKEASIDNEATISTLLKQFMTPTGKPKKVEKARLLPSPAPAPSPSTSTASTRTPSALQFPPIVKTKEEWIAEFKKQGIVINEAFLRKNGFKLSEGSYATSPENLQRAISQAPSSSDARNARFQEQLKGVMRVNPRTPLATIFEEADEVATPAPATSTKLPSITVLEQEAAHAHRVEAEAHRHTREATEKSAHPPQRSSVLRVPERPEWLEAAPAWLRQGDGTFAANCKKEKQNALMAALKKALVSKVPSLNVEGFTKGELFYLVIKKIHDGTASEILDKLHGLPLMEKFYLFDIACGAAKFAQKGATKNIMETFFIDGIAQANSLERSRLKSYVIMQLNEHEDEGPVAAFYNFVLDLVGAP